MNHNLKDFNIIDVHSHIYPEPYLKHLEERQEIPRVLRRGEQRFFAIFPEEVGSQGTGGRPMGVAFWSLEEKLAFMERNGIQRTVISLGNPWFSPMPTPQGDALAAQVNEWLAQYRALTGGRIVAIGALPASSVQAAIRELSCIHQNEGLVGVSAAPAIAGLELDDPRLEPFWEELARLDLPLFIHPENGIAVHELQGYGHALPIAIGFPTQTTLAAARLVFGGVLQRFPTLRLLLAHGGGTLPFLAGRLDAVWRSDPALQTRLTQPPSAFLRYLHYDALVYQAASLQTVVRVADPGRVLFGTDHPFSVADPQANIRAVFEEFGETPAARKVFADNAREFFSLDR